MNGLVGKMTERSPVNIMNIDHSRFFLFYSSIDSMALFISETDRLFVWSVGPETKKLRK